MGATGTGKSKLSIDLATRFQAEIINSDKIQVYKGLDVVTNKVTDAEQQGVPHHILGDVDPEADFTADEFCRRALSSVESIIQSGKLPIIVGGSNTYIETLVDADKYKFRSKYESCFIWVDVSLPVHHSFVAQRVDRMVESGLVDEIRKIFVHDADYSRGIRRAIGVPEMDQYLRTELLVEEDDQDSREKMLKAAINEIKENTCKLTCSQLEKIDRLRNEVGWEMHRIDATEVFEKFGQEADDAWKKVVADPSIAIVREFLGEEEEEAAATVVTTLAANAIDSVEVEDEAASVAAAAAANPIVSFLDQLKKTQIVV
ncbi:hypothetical protein HHK36_010071 [Tetracentron sinense]|uniref:adenylate dimethylallyltransferase (ADP/ATP-dependent) n=1 Tax=Tetracentron sinense TaxID=13715 RepID=A0A834ZMR7_TETSI|nr:hypothetical protein HHK36_010071 [Tetracentron sinense]